jgi:hypothetical protein
VRALSTLVLIAACLAHPVAAQNLVVNSGFDLDPTDPANGWATDGTGWLSHILWFGDPAPPSARTDCEGAEWLVLSQCVRVAAGESYEFSARSYTHHAITAATNSVSLSFFSDPDCSAGWLTTVATDHQSFPNWALRWSTDVIAPAGATAARIELNADAAGYLMNISWDDVVVTPTHAVFVDGFESGGTAAWSAAVP